MLSNGVKHLTQAHLHPLLKHTAATTEWPSSGKARLNAENGRSRATSCPQRYLTASLLLEGPGDERDASLDDSHVFYPPALRQLGVRGDLDQLQAHLLPQRPRQTTELTLGFGQVHRDLSVLTTISHRFPKGLWDASHHGVGEAAIRAHVCHDFDDGSVRLWN